MAKPRPIAKPKPRFSKAAPPITLVQQREASCTHKPGRSLTRRDTDKVCQKVLRDNFPGWEDRIDTVFRDGLTVRMTLMRDIRMRREGGITMGKMYYISLREKFTSSEASINAFFCSDDSEPIDPTVHEALLALKGRTLNTKPLTIVLQHDNAASERTVVAILKASLDLNPSQHYKQTSMIIEICKWAVRNNIDKHTASTRNIVRSIGTRPCRNTSCTRTVRG